MPWFKRRHETLNEQLLREAGYTPEGTPDETATASEPEPEARSPEPEVEARAPGSVLEALGVRSVGRPRPRAADVVATASAPELNGTERSFTALPDGSLLVDDGSDDDLSQLADAVEEHLEPPYRATAIRREGGLWVISAQHIEVAKLRADGDELELTSVAGERTYTVDGRRVEETLAPPKLAALGAARSDDYAVHAVRLDGELWQIDADPL